MTNPPRRLAGPYPRGIGLIESLIAVAILSFGLIGLMGMQARMISSATEAQLRGTAAQLADELLSLARVDTGNAACYTLPQAGTCSSAVAAASTTDWGTRVGSSLPGTVTRTVSLNAPTGRLTVRIGWTARDTADAARLMEVATDVRN